MKIAIGLDIGGTNVKAVVVSENGERLFSYRYPTPVVQQGDKESLKERLVNILRDFINRVKEQDIGKTEIAGIGVGVAGLVDTKRGIVIESPNIEAMVDIGLRELYEREFQIPVIIENDANSYAYGEKWIGAGKDLDTFIIITLGTGLGGGLIYKGELFTGPFEIGHMVIEPNGRFCPCGNWGCLESYASGRAIMDRATSSLEKGAQSMLMKCCDGNFYKLTPADVYNTALEGDTLSREIFRELGQYLGIGISNLINLVGPEAIIIGGGLIGAWDLFIEELKKEVSKRAFKMLLSETGILKSGLRKDDGGAMGSAGLALRALL